MTIHTKAHDGLQGFGATEQFARSKVLPHFPAYSIPEGQSRSLGSYYEADYWRNPVPYTSSDIGEPVPGWGTTTCVAGPAHVGVGAVPRQQFVQKWQRTGPQIIDPSLLTQPMDDELPPETQPDAPGKPTPWWVWPIGAAAVMGAIGFYGTKKGWF